MGSLGKHQGFTLLEIMLVLVVLGMMLGLATLAVPDTQANQLRNESSRLALVIDEMQLEALMQGTTVGLLLSENGYQVMSRDPISLEWQPASRLVFAEHVLPAGLQLEVLAPENVELPADDGLPQLVFDASGAGAPFLLRVYLPDRPEYERRVGSDGYQGAELQ